MCLGFIQIVLSLHKYKLRMLRRHLFINKPKTGLFTNDQELTHAHKTKFTGDRALSLEQDSWVILGLNLSKG